MASPFNAYDFLKDFAGPVSTLIAAIAAVCVTIHFNRKQTEIAATQRDIAEDKLRDDVFGRRYEIYKAAKDLIEYVMHIRSSEKCDPTVVRGFYLKLDEAQFFFSSKLTAHLDDIRNSVEKMLTLIGTREIMYRGDDEQWAKSADEIGKLSYELNKTYGALPKRFAAEMAFRKVIEEK
jgi:hypothetical protein